MIFFRKVPHLSLYFLCVVYTLLHSANLLAAENELNISQNQTYNLAPFCSFYIESKDLSFEEVQKEKFQGITSSNINLGNLNKTVWLKFTIKNSINEPLTIELGKPHMFEAILYESSGSGTILHSGGSLYALSRKDYRHNRLWFRINPFEGNKTLYLKLNNPNKTLPISISPERLAFEKKGNEDMFFGISFGILFMVLFSTLFLYVGGGETVYLYYIGYIFFVNLTSAFLVGYTPEFLTNSIINVGYYNHVLMALSAIFLTLFSASFLEIKKHTPNLFWPIYVFLGLEIVSIILFFTGFEYYSSILIQLFTFGSALYLLPTAVIIYQKGQRNVRFYIAAWFIGWTFIVSYLLTINDLIPTNFFTLNGVLLGSIFESILFSIALADKIQLIKKSTEDANEQMLRMLKENEKLIIRQKEELSKQVLERTKELADKNSELEKYSKGLETLVVERAREIIKMNDELKLQNQRLEQYTFIAAHNIRGPVARIQGLLYLLKLEDPTNRDQHIEIISRLDKSLFELDSIVKDLSLLLEIDRDLQSEKSIVVLDDLLNNILYALEFNLEKEKVFQLNFEAKEIQTFRPLLYSIVYHLISNSYKFKSSDRDLSIVLHTWEDKRYFYLSVKDNGLGMDAKKFKRKLFAPYQRFHPEIDGKGIGLFLVKTQVEALGGTLELNSEPNQGTEITITLIKS